MTETVAVVTAAGSGERLGAGIPKAFVELGGCTMLEHAVDGLLASGVIDRVVVAAPAHRCDETADLLRGRATVVEGGPERHDTVRLALGAVGDPAFVLVHDAARPLTPVEQIRRVVAALRDGSSALTVAEARAKVIPLPPPRTKWTRRVPHPVLIGHAASLTPY